MAARQSRLPEATVATRLAVELLPDDEEANVNDPATAAFVRAGGVVREADSASAPKMKYDAARTRQYQYFRLRNELQSTLRAGRKSIVNVATLRPLRRIRREPNVLCSCRPIRSSASHRFNP